MSHDLKASDWCGSHSLVVGVLAFDQLTKEWALGRLSDGSAIEVLPTVQFALTFNRGFSFSIGSGNGNLVGFAVIAICVVLSVLIVRETHWRRTILLAVILGGALGNLVDRAFRADEGLLSGAVIDFIDVEWYAVFNVADIFVVGGIAFLFVDELLRSRSELRAANAETVAAASG